MKQIIIAIIVLILSGCATQKNTYSLTTVHDCMQKVDAAMEHLDPNDVCISTVDGVIPTLEEKKEVLKSMMPDIQKSYMQQCLAGKELR